MERMGETAMREAWRCVMLCWTRRHDKAELARMIARYPPEFQEWATQDDPELAGLVKEIVRKRAVVQPAVGSLFE